MVLGDLVRCWPLGLWLAQLVLLAPILAVVALQLCLGRELGVLVYAAGPLSLAYAILVVVVALARRGRSWIFAHGKQLALFAVTAILTYGLCELGVSTLCVLGRLPGPERHSFWVYENSQQTVHFDPIRGYILTATPSRCARITCGTPEYVGTMKGNAQGFPDRDDFTVQRSNPLAQRFAVFGDSFTSAQFLQQNWPDVVEDLTRTTGQPLELLNLSLDGGGLANWWSVLTKIVAAEQYQIDGVVFVVFGGDLARGFAVSEHRGSDRPRFGRVPSWDPSSFPATREEAEKYLEPNEGHILTTSEFESACRGQWQPKRDLARPAPYLADRCFRWIKAKMACSAIRDAFRKSSFSSPQRRLVEDIACYLKSKNIPAMVVHVPDRTALLNWREPGIPVETREFAELIGAKLVNGALAFQGLGGREIRADWLPYDGHWGQSGSNRFARFMAKVLADWKRSDPQKSFAGS